MKLKYRIKKITFSNNDKLFIAQYKILGLWLNIKKNLIGNFIINSYCYCENLDDAHELIRKHKLNNKRAQMWGDKQINVVWKDKI